MCRLFGMSGGDEPVRATFWLLRGARFAVADQSRREPDGTGHRLFRRRRAAPVAKQPLAAYEDRDSPTRRSGFDRGRSSPTSGSRPTAALTMPNTHPFERDRRLFAHNGVIGDLPALESSSERTGCVVSATPTPSAGSR